MPLDSSTNRIVPSYVNSAVNLPLTFRNGFLKNIPVQVGTGELNFYGYNLYNPNTVSVYLKTYDKATAPTVGADNVVEMFQVPAGGSVVLRGTDIMQHFSLGMWIAFTTGSSDVDNTAPASNCFAQIFYKQ